MSIFNFGKIILFRVEDLLESNLDAYYPSTPYSSPFVKGEQDPLEYTARKWYRILGKNYKLENGALNETIYDDVGPQYFQDPGSLLARNRIFDGFAKLPSLPSESEIDKVIFYWVDDNVILQAFEAQYGKRILFGPSNAPGFINHNLSLSKPLMSNQNIPQLDQYGAGDSIKVKPIYNYYLKDYEQFYDSLSSRVNFDINYPEERSIPNFYYLLSLLVSPELFSQATENSPAAAPFSIKGILEGIIPPANGSLSDSPLGLTLSREIIQSEQQDAFRSNSVVVITPSYYKSLANEIKTQKVVHPFYNEINIPITTGGTVFRDLFKKAKMYEQLQYRAGLQIKIINKLIRLGASLEDITSQYNIIYTEAQFSEDGLKVTYKSSDNRKKFELPYRESKKNPRLIEFNVNTNLDGINYDFKNSNIVQNINFQNYVSPKTSVMTTGGKLNGSTINFNLSKIPNSAVTSVRSPMTFYANNPTSENSYISSVIQDKAKSILEYVFNKSKLSAAAVFSNSKNYSEVLFFEVQKLDVNENLIQTFILPNDPTIGSNINYVDSQIKYGKAYIYKIYAHTISVGNKLRRGGSNNQSINNFQQLIFDYINDLDIKLLRVPYNNTKEFGEVKRTINLDNPPIPPQITFYPFKNISDKIGFWFNVGLGSLKMKPILDLEESKSNALLQFANLILNQLESGEITYEDFAAKKLLYSTDDFGGKIQIYRITTKPTSYEDFKGQKIADVDVVGPRTLINDIVPNQDYYYIFRHIDVHGLPSNPTPVYHLKMINTDSAMEAGSVRVGVEGLQPILFNELIYLNGNTYDEQEVEKSFKKYLLIEPTLAQTYLSFDNFETDEFSDFTTAIDVKKKQNSLKIGKGGDEFTSVKGKKFKIRVTSKQTGRKIDLNVDFKNLSVIENYKE